MNSGFRWRMSWAQRTARRENPSLRGNGHGAPHPAEQTPLRNGNGKESGNGGNRGTDHSPRGRGGVSPLGNDNGADGRTITEGRDELRPYTSSQRRGAPASTLSSQGHASEDAVARRVDVPADFTPPCARQ